MGRPRVEAVRVCVTDPAGRRAEGTVPTTYFTTLAHAAAAQCVARGVLPKGDLFRYEVLAERDTDAEPAPSISVEASRPPINVIPGVAADYARAGRPFGETNDEDMAVYIPREVLDEAVQMSHDAGAIETGGFLIGHLLHDASIPDVFAVVTAQVPASHTRAEMAKLTLTPDSWADVRNVLEVRDEEENILGWWHSHPYMKETCGDCAKQHDGSCTVNAAFMSEADCHVHRACFSRAYSLALVVADTPCSPTYWSLFGWRRGMIGSRGFSILEPSCAVGSTEPAAVTTLKGT